MIPITVVINPIAIPIVIIHLLNVTIVTITTNQNATNPVITITPRHIVPLLATPLILITVMRKPIVIHAPPNTLHAIMKITVIIMKIPVTTKNLIINTTKIPNRIYTVNNNLLPLVKPNPCRNPNAPQLQKSNQSFYNLNLNYFNSRQHKMCLNCPPFQTHLKNCINSLQTLATRLDNNLSQHHFICHPLNQFRT